MPPVLAKDFEYSSVSIERHTPVPGVSPNGPSPLMPLVICENIEFRNTASKSCDDAFGLDRAGGLDRLQNADQVAGPDAEPVEAVDELLQRYAVFHQREFLAVFGD